MDMRTVTRVAPLLVAALISSTVVAQKKDEKAPKPPQVSKQILKPLIAAQEASKKEQWADCVAKIKEVEAFENRTPYDNYVLNDILGFCALRTGDNPLAISAWSQVVESEFADAARASSLRKGLLQLSYQGKDYVKAVQYGRKLIEMGTADEAVYLLTIQSYYLQNDFKGSEKLAVDYITSLEQKAQTPPDLSLQLYASSCIKQDNDICTMNALEKQAKYFPKKETWPNLSLLLFRSGGEANTLNIFRIARDAGGLTRGEEYTEMAQLSIEKGLPGEAQSTIEEGQAKGLYSVKATQDLANRLLATAKAQAAADKPTLIKQDIEAAGKKNGEVDARIALAFMSYGDYEKAAAAFERGLAKGNVRNPEETKLNLGISQLKAGKKDAAVATLSSVQGDDTLRRLARLWTQRAR